jgi:predicted ferric reductase
MTTAVSPRIVAGGRPARHDTRRAQADRAWDVTVVVIANAVVLVGLWLRHGGIDTLHGAGGPATALGQLTGLLGTYAVLLELLLMSRLPWLERYAGLDRLAVWHRWTGFAAVDLLLVHTIAITVGYAAASRQSLAGQTLDFIRHSPDVLMAFGALAAFLAVALTSMRRARRKLDRESWYFVHLYAYLAVALAFAHQLAVGSDFVDDRAARLWWVALYVAVGGAIVGARVVTPAVVNLRSRFHVERVVREAPGVVSLHVRGHHVDRLAAQGGQFFHLRLLTRNGWWRSHPFSLSAQPTAHLLRFTIKELGDHTGRLQRVRPGTRVFLEGPFGTFTAASRTHAKVALIAGGIGITPLRAILDTLPGGSGDLTLLYRSATPADVVFDRELQWFADKRVVTVHHLIGTDIGDDHTDQLGIPALRSLVPDIDRRDVYVCGPPPLLQALRRRLRHLGVPRRHIHCERFDL